MPFSGTPEEKREKRKAWYAANRQQRKDYAKARRNMDKESYNRREAERHRRLMLQAKSELVAALGGKCQRCGFPDSRAFQFHHVYWNGAEARKNRKGYTYAYYRKLKAELAADASSIRLLCANCHIIIHCEKNDERPEPAERSS